MFIKKLILKHYNRFTLNSIDYFEYAPCNSNLIVGSNGSGKSSLISQLSPLPVSKTDFNKGYKEIHLSHRGDEYIIVFDNGKYSFKKNSIELNESHTVKTQTILVQEHFGLTQWVFDVLTNQRLFTEMSPSERKDWFILVSPINYEYLLKVFQKAKIKLRDLQGAHKIVSSRATSIERGLLSKDEVNILEKEIAYLKSFIEDYSVKIDTGISKHEKGDANALLTHYKRLRDKIVPYSNYEQVKYQLEYSKSQIQQILNRLDKLEEESKQNNVFKEIQEIEDKLKHLSPLDIDDVSLVKSLLYDRDDFKTIIFDLQDMKSYKHEELINIRELTRRSTDQYNALLKEKERIEKIVIEQETALKSDDVTCPKCDTSFKVGYDPSTLVEAKDKLYTLEKRVEDIDKQLSRFNNELSAMTDYFDKHNRLKDILSNTPKLMAFIYKGSFNETYQELIGGLEDTEVYQKLYKDLLSLKEVQQRLDKANENRQKEINEEIENLQFKLNLLNRRVSRLTKKLDFIKQQEALKKSIKEAKEELEKGYQNLDGFLKSKMKEIENEYYTKSIQQAKVLLNGKESTLMAFKNEEHLYKKTKEEIETLDKEISAMKDIVEGLSPNKGLIAKTLIGFLNDFVNEVNKIISKVWSYDMKVLAPSIDGGDLDYKFKVMANGEERRDIAHTSTGMSEMINLAFKLVSMKFMDMEDYPIYLDEFAASFDVEHKQKSLPFLNELKDKCSQMFLISHYENIVSVNACPIVLDSDNINMSIFNEYNTNVIMK